MNQDIVRKHVVRGALAAAIAGVGWHVVVGPLQKSLEREHALAADQGRLLVTARERASALDSAEGMLPTLRERAGAVGRAAAATSDPSKLYDAITRVAREAQVRVDRLDPVTTPGARNPETTVSASDFSIEVTGTYVAIADFLHAIDHDLGFSKVRAFRLTPLEPTPEGTQIVRAVIETTHHQVDPFPNLEQEPR